MYLLNSESLGQACLVSTGILHLKIIIIPNNLAQELDFMH